VSAYRRVGIRGERVAVWAHRRVDYNVLFRQLQLPRRLPWGVAHAPHAETLPTNADPPIRRQVPNVRRPADTPTRRHVSSVLWLAVSALSGSLLPAADPPGKALPTLSEEAKSAAARGVADFRNDNFQDAKNDFQKMTELAPAHPMAWANLGSAEFRLGETAHAEEHLKKALLLDPTAQQAWLTLGIIDYQKNDLDAGLAALSQAVYLDPRDPKAHLYLGILIRKRGWLEGAEDEMRKAIDLDEQYAEAHFNLAVLYLERQPPAIELARRHYYRALKLGAERDAELDRVFRKTETN
jgi:Flp pilus assembly protein TadD